MLQTIDGREVFVVEFTTMPELPVTGFGLEGLYAEALTAAIEGGIVTEPGKYAIELYEDNTKWMVARVVEPDVFSLIVTQPKVKERSMYRTIRIQIARTKQFVKEHPTPVACVITGAVAWKLSHDTTIKGVIEETTMLAHRWGQEVGVLGVALDESLAFIREQGLEHEFSEYANMQLVSA